MLSPSAETGETHDPNAQEPDPAARFPALAPRRLPRWPGPVGRHRDARDAILRRRGPYHPAAQLDETANAEATSETVVLAGGCFWGVQGVFQHVQGVTSAVSGYAGGEKNDGAV